MYIYKIEAMCPLAHLTGQAIYIGQTTNYKRRWRQHAKRFPTNQYTYEILLVCDKEHANFFEKAFINGYDSHRNGLNRTIGGTDIRCLQHTSETKSKQSISARKRFSDPLQKEKLRAALLKRFENPDERQKLSDAHKGKTLSEEHKAKIRLASSGMIHTDAAKEKMSVIANSRPLQTCPYCNTLAHQVVINTKHGKRCKLYDATLFDAMRGSQTRQR